MRYPNHIILDIKKDVVSTNSIYWVNRYTNSFIADLFFMNTLMTVQNFKVTKNSIINSKLSTTFINYTNFVVQRPESTNKVNPHLNSSLLWSLFDINFIKREKLYTKLKYSRSPAYDIVSGGVAALLAGFLGFLISEKFGIELVDSGDFYIFFMYIVFLCFSTRPLIKLLSKDDTIWNFFSYRFLLNYYSTILVLILKSITKCLSYFYYRLLYLFF